MRGARAVLLLLLPLVLLGCGSDPFGSPPRVATHGYRADLTIKGEGPEVRYELAVRPDRVQLSPHGTAGPTLLVRLDQKALYALDPLDRTYTRTEKVPPLESLSGGLPLRPGFDDHAEAARRGLTEYHRESDSVFAGHACWIWRFDDRPSEERSPSTTYWVAPDLDSLVVRVERQEPRADGTSSVRIAQLTNVRVNAPASLFEIPKGYRLATDATPSGRRP